MVKVLVVPRGLKPESPVECFREVLKEPVRRVIESLSPRPAHGDPVRADPLGDDLPVGDASFRNRPWRGANLVYRIIADHRVLPEDDDTRPASSWSVL